MELVRTHRGTRAPLTSSEGESERRLIRVRGVVQGVGFRPFVHRLATAGGIAGTVCNDRGGVLIDAFGSAEMLEEFQRGLTTHAPAPAQVHSVEVELRDDLEVLEGFRIVDSIPGDAPALALLPSDTAVCEQCLAEMHNPADRRFRYPFVTCTACGPRFTITTALPYDRPNTTMAGFEMCDACRSEYEDPRDRRYHAQPLACPRCGPHLALLDAGGSVVQRRDSALSAAQRRITDGAILAIKSLGGYHLVCDARNAEAVSLLRSRKRRGSKPFAVMVTEAEVLGEVASISPAELAALTSPQRPIVLLRRLPADQRAGSTEWVDNVAPGSADVGAMLPSAPLHHLLMDGLATNVIVCTSGNLADEPIAVEDDEAVARLASLADGWLVHDRPIHTPCDDSVVRSIGGAVVPLRRARGFTPLPVQLGEATDSGRGPVLAMGGDLKGAVCVTAGTTAWLSQHLGDHGQLATYTAARQAAQQMLQLLGVTPELVAIDAHPGYLSARLGRELAAELGIEVISVQHHHAHLAALLGEHQVRGPAIGFVFDGTGYGTDATIWGGEVLVGNAASVERVGHLQTVLLPGGDAAVEYPRRSALAHLYAAGLPWDERIPAVSSTPVPERQVLRQQFITGALTVPTSSMGRLFDAVASLVGLCHSADYEAEAAILLGAAATPETSGAYSFGCSSPEGAFDAGPVIAAVCADVIAGEPAGAVSMRFHRAVSAVVLREARRVRDSHGLNTVGITGGVFQNTLLVEACSEALSEADFEVLWHQLVPTNDGGLALGQALVAAGRN